jgi:hypothetical protein
VLPFAATQTIASTRRQPERDGCLLESGLRVAPGTWIPDLQTIRPDRHVQQEREVGQQTDATVWM